MYPLTPLIHPVVEKYLKDHKKTHELLSALGSPLNLIFPEIAIENLKKYEQLFTTHKIQAEIFYAYKANKSLSVLRELSTTNSKVDVASIQELKIALSSGFSGDRIEATGPKNAEFLLLALQHGVTINLNSEQEFNKILELRRSLNLSEPTKIFIRVHEFQSQNRNFIWKDNKFGVNLELARSLLLRMKALKTELQFLGFSFHLTTTSEQERVVAIEQLFGLTLEAIQAGLDPKGINIGGGFSVNHLLRAKEWHDYMQALRTSIVSETHEEMSWNKSGLGLWSEDGKIRGTPSFSDFYREVDQYRELENVLQAKIKRYGKILDFLQENALTLYIEPGRSMLDQVGVTIATVESISRSLKGETVAFLNMNRSHIGAIEYEFMSDPLIIPKDKRKLSPTNSGVFLSGNLCLPHDFITRRKVFLPHKIEPGDALAFINTAGYFMDFTESETIQHPTARKIAIHDQAWSLDELYQPTLLQKEPHDH